MEIFPKLSIFDYVDLRQFLTYESEVESKVSSVSYSNGIITLEIDYSQHLENAETNLSLTFSS